MNELDELELASKLAVIANDLKDIIAQLPGSTAQTEEKQRERLIANNKHTVKNMTDSMLIGQKANITWHYHLDGGKFTIHFRCNRHSVSLVVDLSNFDKNRVRRELYEHITKLLVSHYLPNMPDMSKWANK